MKLRILGWEMVLCLCVCVCHATSGVGRKSCGKLRHCLKCTECITDKPKCQSKCYASNRIVARRVHQQQQHHQHAHCRSPSSALYRTENDIAVIESLAVIEHTHSSALSQIAISNVADHLVSAEIETIIMHAIYPII